MTTRFRSLYEGSNTTLLFQYGSNMAENVLRAKIEQHAARFAPEGTQPVLSMLGLAHLSGWRFTLGLFSATGGHRVADIVESGDGHGVWGALYELPAELVCRSDGARSVLDRIEGHRTSRDPDNYTRVQISVDFNGGQEVAWTYVGRPDARERCAREHQDARVPRHYVDAILSGARALRVPDPYLADLQALLEAHTNLADY